MTQYSTYVGMSFLKLSIFDPIFNLRMDQDKFLINTPCTVNLFISQLHVDVWVPCLLIWFPLHPAFKDLPRTSHVTQHLLHVWILVPEIRERNFYPWNYSKLIIMIFQWLYMHSDFKRNIIFIRIVYYNNFQQKLCSPKLVHSWKNCHCSVPNIPCMVYLTVSV